MTRWMIYGALCACGLFAFLGHLYGPEFDARQHREHHLANLNAAQPPHSGPAFLDGERGAFKRVPLPLGDELEFASVAPWRDGLGRSQIVGRWTQRTGDGTSSVPSAFGLGRFSYPEGQPIERIKSSVTPASPPIWITDTTACVLFAGTDGRLYRFSFEGPTGRDSEPRLLDWRVPGVDPGDVLVCEIARGPDGHLPDLIIATVRSRHERRAHVPFSAPRLWWLALDAAASRVVDGGPLTNTLTDMAADAPISASEGLSSELSERFPTLARSNDHRLLVAYLARPSAQRAWSLCIAQVEHTEGANPPLALGKSKVLLDGECAGSTPSFSSEPGWIHAIEYSELESSAASAKILSAKFEHLGAARPGNTLDLRPPP